MPLLTIIVVVFLVGVLIPKRPGDSSSIFDATVKVPYFVFLLSLASSPVIGALIKASLSRGGNSVGFLQYIFGLGSLFLYLYPC